MGELGQGSRFLIHTRGLDLSLQLLPVVRCRDFLPPLCGKEFLEEGKAVLSEREPSRPDSAMDQILNKVGSYWIGQKANKELNSVGDDLNSLSSSIQGGASWFVNKMKGKMQKALPELLKEYNLPVGLFPRDATNYEFHEETKKLTVFIPSICEVGYKDGSVLRFFTTVSGYLEKGKLVDIEGMKTKVMIWVKVTIICTEGPKLQVTAGVKKSRRREAYEVLRDGVTVDKF